MNMSEIKNKHSKGKKCYLRNSQNDTLKSLSKPFIIGYMSVDVARQYHSDLSQLKFINSIYNAPTSMDLNHNINAAVKRTTDDSDEKINLLLKFLADKHKYLFRQFRVDFITYRRTLISIMCVAFRISEPVIIKACLYKGSIYLCSIESTQETCRRKSRSKDEEKYCAWGYKFEQYLLSDNPNLAPDIQKPVIENEEFSLYYYTELGNFKLLYGAQIDGLLTENFTMEKPNTTDFEANLKYLRNNSFVELKTNREIQNFKQDRNFKCYKLLRCWCQCYLANLRGLFVGFRNDQGVVERLQWFNTQDIVSNCKNEWNPEKAVEFLGNFLDYIKRSFEPYQNLLGPITQQFQINIDKSISVIDNCSNDVIPTWYTQV